MYFPHKLTHKYNIVLFSLILFNTVVNILKIKGLNSVFAYSLKYLQS